MNQLLSPSRILLAKLGKSGTQQLNHCALLSCSKRLGASDSDKIESARSREGKLRIAHPKGDDGKQPAEFDQLTHTGQAWDKADWRLTRFEYSPKQVNPNIAAHLIAELAPVPSEEHTVRCDGGHRELGHPRVYINLDKPGTHACGYCGQRFYNVHSTKPEELDIAHIQV
uniref:Zinc finger CHCC-type domain-containing protein n=1 Tax=Globodera rostochiensis TaxID=31243 RepID=A0A914HEV9_GLORO